MELIYARLGFPGKKNIHQVSLFPKPTNPNSSQHKEAYKNGGHNIISQRYRLGTIGSKAIVD